MNPWRRATLQALAAFAASAMARSSRSRTGSMLSRPIPASGEPLPVIGLGTWQVFDAGADAAARAPLREVLKRFHADGGRLVDSSPMYGSAESVVGELCSELAICGQLFIATKVWTSGRAQGIRQMETSFRRLRVRTIDLMQVHNLVDVATHAATLAEWKAAGRVRYIGITHYTASAYDEVEKWLEAARWDFLQINYSLAEREAERRLLALARERAIAVIANRPFAEGALFRRVRGKPLPGWAADLGIASWAQFFLKWILGHPAVTCVIPGTGRPEHAVDNLAAGLAPFPDEAQRVQMARHFESL
jgi:aryl-alcohol dehydrogenase-like predicted oxidoreductase